MLPASSFGRPLLRKAISVSPAYTYTCLPCQLRQVHDALGPIDAAGADDVFSSKQSSVKWKHIHPHGRVVGKGNKRQRVASADLTRKSLDKPSTVVVLHDYADENGAASTETINVKDTSHHPDNVLSARDIEDEVVGRRRIPNEAEVKQSIDALKPKTSLLAEREFNELVKHLTTSYTQQQLSRYLAVASRAQLLPGDLGVTPKNKTPKVEIPVWQSGETPLSQRRKAVTELRRLGRKERAAHRIVRLIWNTRVDSEEQEVGEVELRLVPWQLSMLFDPAGDGNPGYRKFLSSGLIGELNRIDPYRPDGVARITGRRHDAEEIAAQLQAGLMAVSQVKLDMNLLKNTVSTLDVGHDVLATDLRRVAALTESTIEPLDDASFVIYSRTESGANHAHRLLLSLLHMSKDIVSPPTGLPDLSGSIIEQGHTTQIHAHRAEAGIHQHLSALDLTRTVETCASGDTDGKPKSATDKVNHISAAEVVNVLNQAANGQLTHKPSHHARSYWNAAVQNQPWTAQVGKILRTPALRLNEEPSEVKRERLILQPLAPRIESLLSKFKPIPRPRLTTQHFEPIGADSPPQKARPDRGAKAPFLKAYFLASSPDASSSSAQRPLPKLQISFDFTSHDGSRGLTVTAIEAVLDTTNVPIPLPHRAVDLVFSTSSTVLANIDSIISTDDNVKNFVNILENSVANGDGALSAPRELTVRLPRSMVQQKSQHAQTTGSSAATEEKTADEDVPITYLLERFEQIQEIDLMPNPQMAGTQGKDASPSSLLALFGDNLLLRYRDVEGGTVYGGGRTELSIHLRTDKGKEGDAEAHTAQLAATALRMAELLDQGFIGE